MNKTLKSIVMMFIICVLGYTQIGCKADNIKNENPQAIKDYSNQAQSEDKSNQNSNESKDDNGNLTSQVEKLSSNAEIHFIDTGNSDAILIIKDNCISISIFRGKKCKKIVPTKARKWSCK